MPSREFTRAHRIDGSRNRIILAFDPLRPKLLPWCTACIATSSGPRASVSRKGVPAAREYLRRQGTHHPNDAIAGWGGDEPEYEPSGEDEWRSKVRRRV